MRFSNRGACLGTLAALFLLLAQSTIKAQTHVTLYEYFRAYQGKVIVGSGLNLGDGYDPTVPSPKLGRVIHEDNEMRKVDDKNQPRAHDSVTVLVSSLEDLTRIENLDLSCKFRASFLAGGVSLSGSQRQFARLQNVRAGRSLQHQFWKVSGVKRYSYDSGMKLAPAAQAYVDRNDLPGLKREFGTMFVSAVYYGAEFRVEFIAESSKSTTEQELDRRIEAVASRGAFQGQVSVEQRNAMRSLTEHARVTCSVYVNGGIDAELKGIKIDASNVDAAVDKLVSRLTTIQSQMTEVPVAYELAPLSASVPGLHRVAFDAREDRLNTLFHQLQQTEAQEAVIESFKDDNQIKDAAINLKFAILTEYLALQKNAICDAGSRIIHAASPDEAKAVPNPTLLFELKEGTTNDRIKELQNAGLFISGNKVLVPPLHQNTFLASLHRLYPRHVWVLVKTLRLGQCGDPLAALNILVNGEAVVTETLTWSSPVMQQPPKYPNRPYKVLLPAGWQTLSFEVETDTFKGNQRVKQTAKDPKVYRPESFPLMGRENIGIVFDNQHPDGIYRISGTFELECFTD